MSWVDLRDDLTLFEYYCLLAESLDAEELEDHNTASLVAIGVNNPKAIKKWKWALPDKAGTRPGAGPGSALVNAATLLSGGKMKASGKMQEFANATGRPFAYRMQDGSLVDVDGNTVKQTPEMVIEPFKDNH